MEDTMKIFTHNNLSYQPTVEELNRAITSVAPGDAPFYAVHPDVAGRRNPIRAIDEEPITLGAAQELHPRQHADSRPLLRAKKK